MGMSEMRDIVDVEVKGDYALRLTFDDGAVRDVSLEGQPDGPVFAPLRDPELFARGGLRRVDSSRPARAVALGFVGALEGAVIARPGKHRTTSWWPFGLPNVTRTRLALGLATALAMLAAPAPAAGALLTIFPLPASVHQPDLLAFGRDGALWFNDYDTDRLGRFTAGGLREFQLRRGSLARIVH